MKILLLGSGGREHAIATRLAASPSCSHLFLAPGNPGMAPLGTLVGLNLSDAPAVAGFCLDQGVGLVVVGPEQPLAEGLADFLRDQNIPVVGPGKVGAQLESSKDFSKRFMARHGIPTASYASFDQEDMAAALAYVSGHPLPVVVKASGLAAGKGVVIAQTHAEACAAVEEMLSGKAFGESGTTVVVEAFLSGIELSVFVLTDGKDYVVLPEAKDYKRIGEGDTGPNTGGMGAVSPVPFATPSFMAKVEESVIRPTISGLAQENIPYRGFIFFGLINVEGEPLVIEYNCRMGDPETEVVFPRLGGDVVPMLVACASGSLAGVHAEVRPDACATVMLVSGGYPGDYPKGKGIAGLEKLEGAFALHAGTKLGPNGLETNGGRVLAITALGPTLKEALNSALTNAAHVQFEGKYYRTDIGKDLGLLG